MRNIKALRMKYKKKSINETLRNMVRDQAWEEIHDFIEQNPRVWTDDLEEPSGAGGWWSAQTAKFQVYSGTQGNLFVADCIVWEDNVAVDSVSRIVDGGEKSRVGELPDDIQTDLMNQIRAIANRMGVRVTFNPSAWFLGE